MPVFGNFHSFTIIAAFWGYFVFIGIFKYLIHVQDEETAAAQKAELATNPPPIVASVTVTNSVTVYDPNDPNHQWFEQKITNDKAEMTDRVIEAALKNNEEDDNQK